MTAKELLDLRATYLPGRFAEYREALRDEARRLGHKVGANDVIKILESKALDDNRITAPSSDTASALDELPDGFFSVPNDGGDDGTKKASIAEAMPALEIDEYLLDNGGDEKEGANAELSELQKKMEEAREAAKKAMEEAKAKKKNAEGLRKELEEAQKKLEEELKKGKEKEAEAKKHKRHAQVDELLATLKTQGLAYLVGAAGTGKSTLAMDACVDLFGVAKDKWEFNEHFAQISFSPDTTSSEMIGRCDVNGIYHCSEVVRVFRDGGLILFDEIDNADASMLVKLNTAIANGTIATPTGLVRRNKDTYIVCTANTYGTGANAMYVGRSRLDAATLDRFVLAIIEVDYDENLEANIMSCLSDRQRADLTAFVNDVRDGIEVNKLHRLCSTRFVGAATKWLKQGASFDTIKRKFFFGWSESERKACAK